MARARAPPWRSSRATGPGTGEVLVLGADPATGTRAWRSRIGIVRQDESALAELTVCETVRCFAGYYPALRDPDQVVGLVGLEQQFRAAGSRSCRAADGAVSTWRSV